MGRYRLYLCLHIGKRQRLRHDNTCVCVLQQSLSCQCGWRATPIPAWLPTLPYSSTRYHTHTHTHRLQVAHAHAHDANTIKARADVHVLKTLELALYTIQPYVRGCLHAMSPPPPPSTTTPPPPTTTLHHHPTTTLQHHTTTTTTLHHHPEF